MTLKSIDPYTGKIIGEFEEFTDPKVDEILIHSFEAFQEWKRTSFEYRMSLILKAAEELRTNTADYSASITLPVLNRQRR